LLFIDEQYSLIVTLIQLITIMEYISYISVLNTVIGT
jgi:hypothetical protein